MTEPAAPTPGSTRRRLLQVTLAVAALVAASELIVVLQSRAFDRALWRQAMDHRGSFDAALDEARWQMARRLARYDQLEGLDRGQVRALLGEPDSTFEGGEWWYGLGPHGGPDSSGTMLALRFGDDGAVDRDWILQLP